MEKQIEINTKKVAIIQPKQKSYFDDDSFQDFDEENDEVGEILRGRNTIKAPEIKVSSEDLTTLADSEFPQEVPDSPIRPSVSRLRRRVPTSKRASMTKLDEIIRNNTIQEIKDSTRKIVAFTLNNLDQEKPILHFKNEKFIEETKDRDFEFYYDIKESLGEGCSSVVKRCICKFSKKVFAVKIFRAFDDEYVNFAKNEFNNMKMIENDNVAKVYEMFYNRNTLKIYTVMEFAHGLTLKKLVEEYGPINGIFLN